MSDNGRDRTTGRIRKRVPEALPNIVTILVVLNRETGEVEVDDEFSTPMETENALRYALLQRSDRLERVNGLDAGE